MPNKILLFPTLLFPLVSIMHGCSNSSVNDGAVRKLNRKSAVTLISEYPYFKEFPETTTFSEGQYRIWNSHTVQALEEFGVINIQDASTTGDIKVCIFLTEKGQQLSQEWIETQPLLSGIGDRCPVRQGWLIPIGTPEVIEVTGIKQHSESDATVEFDYQFVPNEMGNLLTSEDSDDIINSATWRVKSSEVQVELYDDGWRITSLGYSWGDFKFKF